MAKFIPPIIQDNPEGWGPTDLPEKFKDMPYQPFSKGDRLGKVSDWSGSTYQDRKYMNKYTSQFGSGNQYSYIHDEDENSFQLVDNAKLQKPAYQRNRFRFNQLRNRQLAQKQRDAIANQVNQKPATKLEKKKERERLRLQRNMQKQYGQGRFRWKEKQNQNQQKRRDASVMVEETWEVLEEMDFTRLSKLRLPDVGEPEDLYSCGKLLFYDKSYDRVTVKSEKPLKRFNKEFHKVTTTDDPIIRRLAKSHGNVFATDAILATLMCCTRSQYSWDIIAQRVGKNKLFFDKRDDSSFDFLTVSETANEPPQEEGLNSPHNLAMEATYINHNFSQQVLKGESYKLDHDNPFVQDQSSSNIASVGYRYRKWSLGNNIELVSRTEHDAVITSSSGDTSFINVKAINEWDHRFCNGIEWRRKLDSQRGSVLATELKNNSCKLAKWTVCSLLAGSEYLKVGYVSRYNIQDSARHVVIGTQQFIPKEFASQINMSMTNAWGILRCIIDICMRQNEGKYLLLKVSDWSGSTYQDRKYMNKYTSQFGSGNQYSYIHDEDENSFQLVDNAKLQKPAYQRNRFRFNQLRNRQLAQKQRDAIANQVNQKPATKLEKKKERERLRLQRNMQKQYGQGRFRWKEKQNQNQQKRRDASVMVEETWEVLEEMDFTRLSKLRLPDVGEPEDLYSCGKLLFYDKSYDRVTVKSEKPLKRFNKEFHKVTTTDDPIIRRLAKSHGNVFATDAILATLMCCTRSQYSWDIIAQRVGKNKLFFDKRDDSSFDFLTVSETANEPPQEEGLNSPHNLAMEATYINHNFSQQVLKGESYKLDHDNPFVQDQSSSNIASVGYRYRKWSLGNNIELVSRTEHDAVITSSSGDTSFINVKAINEWDHRFCNGIEWRRKLDSQRGSVLATELKNNSCKLAKWTVCSLLAGSEYLKVGYVSRYNIQDSARHVVIGTQQFIPKEFASQINMSMTNAWGILRCIIDICMRQNEGKYLLLKDPNKPVIRLYKLPEGTFSSDEDDSSEEDSDDSYDGN